MRDLFRLDTPTGLSSTFIGDPPGSGYSTDTNLLDVPPDLWADYQRAAEDVARSVARDPELLAAILPAGIPPVEELEFDPCAKGLTIFDTSTIDDFTPCCDGVASCVPIDEFPPLLQSEMTPCDDGGACFPNDMFDVMQQAEGAWKEAWNLWARSCSSLAGGDGICMSICFTQVGQFADLTPQDICADGERCVPCLDPLTGKPSGACDENFGCGAFERSDESVATLTEARELFLAHFGQRAFRRPLEAEELARYTALFVEGSDLLDITDKFIAGVEVTLSAMLQSPHFLYRVERSTDVGPDGLIALDGWEIATRLSYALWNTMPSDDLLEAAETGALDTHEGVLQWISDMIEDPRAVAVVDDFHGQYMLAADYRDIQKQPGLFPNFGEDTGVHMRTELDLFIQDVFFDDGGGFSELLLSPHSFVNDELAVLYGLDGADFGEEFKRVELDPTERRGLLTRLGFLADRAGPKHPSPIARGLLQLDKFACLALPPVPPLDPESADPPPPYAPTNRERIALQTGPGTCGSMCHTTLINPPGFAFENYDAVGQYRLEDNGYPVDASGHFTLDGAEVFFDNAIEWTQHLAASQQVHACYTQHWLEYLYGRPVAAADKTMIDEIAAASLAGELSIRELVGMLLGTDSFLKRLPHAQDEEAAP